MELISRVLNHSVDEELITVNPAMRLAKNTEKPRERVLSADELVLLWRELERMEAWKPEPGTGARGKQLTKPLIRAIRILLLTGQRRGEVIGAELPELRLASEPMWELPSSKTKNGLLHRVPLTPMAAFEFRRAVAEAESCTVRISWRRRAHQARIGQHGVQEAVQAGRDCGRLGA